jgi:hypothetical protein
MAEFHCDPLDFPTETRAFYRDVLARLSGDNIRYLVGGAYALAAYTGIVRHSKDLDLFVLPADYPRVLEVMERAGYETGVTYTVWLAKIHHGADFVDVIYRSGNGICEVDEEWFAHGEPARIFDVPVRLCAPEDTIWQKAFIMERERYDGNDVAHYLLAWGDRLDWDRLLFRFGPHWRVLLSHLILFGFIYPGERDRVPRRVLDRLLERAAREMEDPSPETRDCQGSLLSRTFYIVDTRLWGYRDARLVKRGTTTDAELGRWTAELHREQPELLRAAGISLADTAKSPLIHKLAS